MANMNESPSDSLRELIQDSNLNHYNAFTKQKCMELLIEGIESGEPEIIDELFWASLFQRMDQ